MSTELELLVKTTFATPEAAAAALDKANGNVVKARKALGSRKTTPLDPALGENVVALLVAARARGTLAKRNGGALSLLGGEVPRDLSALLYAGTHWDLPKVQLGGARLYVSGMTMLTAARVRGDAPSASEVGALADGSLIGIRLGTKHTWVVAPETGDVRLFDTLDAVLAEIRADAARRGVTTDLDAPPAKPARKRAPGPPEATPGDDHRIYAGSAEIAAEFSDVDLYHRMMVTFRVITRVKLPADDLWLVSREGALYKLSLASKPSGGLYVCWVAPMA